MELRMHTPEDCGAPQCPDDIQGGLEAPSAGKEKAGYPPSGSFGGSAAFEEPTLIIVGPALAVVIGDLQNVPYTNRQAWNTVTRPYGMHPGSTVWVVDTCGGWVGATVYFCMRIEQFLRIIVLHGCGSFCMGVEPSDDVPSWGLCSMPTATGELVPCLQDCGLSIASTIPKGKKYIAIESIWWSSGNICCGG